MAYTTLLASLEEAILDVVENPEAEVEVDHLADLDSQIEGVDSIQDEIAAGENTIEALESLQSLIVSVGAENFTQTHLSFVKSGITAALAGLGVSVQTSHRIYKGLENHLMPYEAALESTSDVVKKVWDGIVAMIKKLIDKIKAVFKWIGEKLGLVKKQDDATEKQLKETEKIINLNDVALEKLIDSFEKLGNHYVKQSVVGDVKITEFIEKELPADSVEVSDVKTNEAKEQEAAKKFFYRLKPILSTPEASKIFFNKVSGLKLKNNEHNLSVVLADVERAHKTLVTHFKQILSEMSSGNTHPSNLGDEIQKAYYGFIQCLKAYGKGNDLKLANGWGFTVFADEDKISAANMEVESYPQLRSYLSSISGSITVAVSKFDTDGSNHWEGVKLPSIQEIIKSIENRKKTINDFSTTIRQFELTGHQLEQIFNTQSVVAAFGDNQDLVVICQTLASSYATLSGKLTNILNLVLKSELENVTVCHQISDAYKAAASTFYKKPVK